MKVMLYERGKQLGMSQGMAIIAIVERIGGRLTKAGEVINQYGGQTGKLYVHVTYGKGEVNQVESIWKDIGTEVYCIFRKTNDDPWERKTDDGWEPVPTMELEFINLADARTMQRIGDDLNNGLRLIRNLLVQDTGK